MRRRGQTRCSHVSSRVGLGPAWQRLNGRERCWSKAGRAAWPSATLPRCFSQRPGIGSLLRHPTHGEVTSMPSSHRSSPHNCRDHGQRNWIEERAARAPTRPWSWRQASRELWREPRWWRPELVAAKDVVDGMVMACKNSSLGTPRGRYDEHNSKSFLSYETKVYRTSRRKPNFRR
jgi:hypothetical protein